MSKGLLSRFLLSVVAAVALAGCTMNPAMELPQISSEPLNSYRLDAGDQVRVVVFGQDDIPTDYMVDDRGFISMPLAGSVEAQGLTTGELEKEIAKKLSNILVNPSISVQALSFRPFYILGGVTHPGAYPYVKNMTVLTAVAIGGGFSPNAYKDYVGVTRNIEGKNQEWRATRSAFVHPGDIVYVYEIY